MEIRTREPKPLQEPLLEQFRVDQTLVSIYLTNGIRLQGFVVGFDSFSILLSNGQMLYKHAIASMGKATPAPTVRYKDATPTAGVPGPRS